MDTLKSRRFQIGFVSQKHMFLRTPSLPQKTALLTVAFRLLPVRVHFSFCLLPSTFPASADYTPPALPRPAQ
jgi:hypothetical protein